MVTFIKIEKDAKQYEEKLDNIENLYKKCGLRKIEGFINLYEYDTSEGKIELWGRNSGRSNIKNSYVFPLDLNLVLYGTVAILLKNGNDYVNLTESMLDKLLKNKKDTVKDTVKDSVINKVECSDGLDNNDSDSDSDSDNNSDSDDSDESDLDSELKLEDYIYSSEEEN